MCSGKYFLENILFLKKEENNLLRWYFELSHYYFEGQFSNFQIFNVQVFNDDNCRLFLLAESVYDKCEYKRQKKETTTRGVL